jgi:hypothetical protein
MSEGQKNVNLASQKGSNNDKKNNNPTVAARKAKLITKLVCLRHL